MYQIESDTMSKIWNELLEKMKATLDVNAFNTFFLPLIPKDIVDSNFILEAPSRFVKEVISSDMFLNKINDSLKEITNTNFEIIVKEKSEFEKKVVEEKKDIEKDFIKMSSNLNPDFSFDNFVVGPCNSECYQASMAVALNPGKFYNPLFIYGRAGIGKTHLLHAIGNYCKANQNRTMNVYYTTANDFIDEFMKSNQNKNIEAMKTKFRSIDILLLDDVQFLAGKDKTGEVFFQIFNNLFNEKKQIVLTSDRRPADLRGLEVRLVSRFSSGLIVGMNAPEYDTAKNILKRKISAKYFDINNVDDDVLTYIAQNYSTDVRQLEGALTRLFFYVTTINRVDLITLPIAMEALKNITPCKKDNIELNADKIKEAVCDYYNITIEQLVGSSRVSTLTIPRFIAIYLCKKMLNITFDEVGALFGNRDHSTIMNACMKIEKKINEDNAYKLVINKLQQSLTN